jgi:mannose-6-phosphate isomerase
MVAPGMLAMPLRFVPVYQVLVWGGRRMARWRSDLPDGPVGESWDLADHDRGMSVVADGPCAGTTLRTLTRTHGADLVGAGFTGGDFPLLVKLIDAADRLSVQVHPDDAGARALGLGDRGKTECWCIIADGGRLWAGLRPGTTAAELRAAVAGGRVAEVLAEHVVADGDVFFLPARTVHAIGAGCLLYEVQQTCDTTFRVDDWGRVGLDGRPRPLHVDQALATIDPAAPPVVPRRAPARPHPSGGTVRELVDCPYFTMAERRVPVSAQADPGATCAIVTCLAGAGRLAVAGGSVALAPMTTWLVPAAAGPWQVHAEGQEVRLLEARPVLRP